LTLEGEIIARESLGSETIYQIRSEAGLFFAKTFLTPVEALSRVKVTIPSQHLYFFGADGQRIDGVALQTRRLVSVGGM
jgi:sn-glycerol 3-phosphate transport system ATP-binding protein